MGFQLEKCVSYITENSIKEISEAFGKIVEEKGVTRIQWIAMYYLDKFDVISQKELAEKMYVTDSSIARLLDRMSRDGLVEREKSTEDRRITYVKLTRKGKNLSKKLMPEGELFSDKLLDGITAEELVVFESVIRKMVNNICEE